MLQHYTFNFKPLIDLSKPIHNVYCNKHGYSFNLKEVPQYDIYNGLDKLNQILEVCEEGDIALIMDADAVITNMNIKVESFITKGKSFYVAEGCNMGVFILVINSETILFIKNLIDWIRSGKFDCEQDAFEYYIRMYEGVESSEFISIVKHPCFNSYLSELYPEIPQPVTEQEGQCVKDSYILHLPALDFNKRVEIMKQKISEIVYE